MILEKFGIKLSSVQVADIEKVRQWRNADYVRENMLFQGQITTEMQRLWYSNLSASEIYLMISDGQRQLGVIHVKDIDWDQRIGEAGIFIGELDYHKTYLPMLAIIGLMDTFFDDLSFSALKATVIRKNEEALNFNRMLGYTIETERANDLTLIVTKKSYQKARVGLDKLVHPFRQEPQIMTLTMEEKSLFILNK